jgi:hypothetical protein
MIIVFTSISRITDVRAVLQKFYHAVVPTLKLVYAQRIVFFIIVDHTPGIVTPLTLFQKITAPQIAHHGGSPPFMSAIKGGELIWSLCVID